MKHSVMVKMATPVVAALAALTALAPALPAAHAAGRSHVRSAQPAPFTVIAHGLNNPRGLAVAPDGSIYVAEAGAGGPGPCVKGGEGGMACLGLTGAVTRIQSGRQTRVLIDLPSVAAKGGAEATGPSNVYVAPDGTVYVSMQGVDSSSPAAFGTTAAALWHVLRLTGIGRYRYASSFYTYEATHNPDGREINSDPYAVKVRGGHTIVADAAANDLLSMDASGRISTLAVFPTRMVPGPGGKAVPMEAVPDSLAMGADGAYYVGELTGFPFPVGGARIYRVVPGQKPVVYASGFTNIIGLAFGPDGNLYVLEIFKGGLGNVNPKKPATLSGALIRLGPGGTRTVIASQGLVAPAGLAIGPDGSIYVSNFGVLPGAGQVVRLNVRA